MTYKIIRSSRRSIGLEVKNGELTVRAPMFVTDFQIRLFVQQHMGWIEDQMKKQASRKTNASGAGKLTDKELKALTDKAKKVIPEKVKYYAARIGVTYGKITIRHQKTRWGSCTSKGNLNFNCLLMLAPDEAVDAIVVHELCHRKEMNHSAGFYAEVRRAYPEYDKWNTWLKKNGGAILDRLPA